VTMQAENFAHFERLVETEYSNFDDRVHSVATPFGIFVTHPGFPTRYDCNQLLRCRCRSSEVGAMLTDLQEKCRRAKLPFQKISGDDPETARVLDEALPREGWRSQRTLVMEFAGNPRLDPNPAVEIRVVDPSHPDLEGLMRENGRLEGAFAYHRAQWPRLGGEWLVGYLDGKPAGCTGWFLLNGIARYRWVGTREACQRHGVASSLIRSVQSLPSVRSADALTIFVGGWDVGENPVALRLYQKLGFRPVGFLWEWLKSTGTPSAHF